MGADPYPRLRLAVYVDAVFRERGGVVYGEIAFTRFASALSRERIDVIQVGRLDHGAGPAHYPLPDEARFIGLPYFPTLTRPGAVVTSLWRSLRAYWRALNGVDGALLFGPSLHAVLFALITVLRRRRLALGVRQDLPVYVRSRRPTLRWMHAAADALELLWRMLAQFAPVVVLGDELARHYRRARRVLPIAVSLITSVDIERGEQAAADRAYNGELTLLSVGRIDQEKNPLLLADVLAALRRDDPRWRLVVCGEGPLERPLAERLAELHVSDSAELRGYVPVDGGLLALFRHSHVFFHVSLTEGLPQVLHEAFASGTPVVATAVGGVPAAAGDAALLVPPQDPEAAVAAISRLARDHDARDRLIAAGFERVRSQTQDHELARLAAFLRAGLRR